MAVLDSVKGGLAKFSKSSAKDALAGGLGAGVAFLTIPYAPQLLGKFTNLVYGVVLLLAGVFVKMDGVGEFLLGAGVIYVIDGIVRLVFPATAKSVTFSASAELASMYPPTAAYA